MAEPPQQKPTSDHDEDPDSGYVEQGAADLVHPAFTTTPVLGRYYRLLNQHKPFTADLAALRASLGDQIGAHPLLPQLLRHEVDPFVQRWHLPRGRGPDDVWGSLRRRYDPPRLGRYAPVAISAPSSVLLGDSSYTIYPPTVDPFPFDPRTGAGRSWALRKIEKETAAFRRSLIDQLDQLEARAQLEDGMVRRPARHQSPEFLDRMADRLFHFLIENWSYDRIAEREYADLKQPENTLSGSTVRSTLRYWLRELDIPGRSGHRGPSARHK